MVLTRRVRLASTLPYECTSIRYVLNLTPFSRHKNGGLVPPNNLWHAFERQVIQDRVQLNLPHSTTLTDIMNKFVTQVGYPLLEVTESVGDDLRKTLKIRQVIFLRKNLLRVISLIYA